MRLWEGKTVKTPLGPARIVRIQSAEDQLPGFGKPIRGVAYAEVELLRGGRRLYAAPELREVENK